MRASLTVALAFACSLAAPLAGCAVDPGQPSIGPAAGTVHPTILGGRSSAAGDDAVVQLKIGAGDGELTCTGTLLAPNLVLTARHCTSELESYDGFACDEKGKVVQGNGNFGADRRPESVAVFTVAGATRAAAYGKKVLHDGSRVVCSHDLALVLLDREVPDARVAPVRLDGKPLVGETFTAIGFGLTESGAAGTRFARPNVTVLRVGPQPVQNQIALPPNDFEAGEAICEGDSGGPAIASSGAVIGVVSRGGAGRGAAPPDSCREARNHYTATAPFKALLLEAYEEAGAEPRPESGDGGLTATGAACVTADQCIGGLCVPLGVSRVCSQPCDSEGQCPQGFNCTTSGGQKICGVSAARNGTQGDSTGPKEGVCAASPAGAHPGAFACGVVALAAAAAARRGRRGPSGKRALGARQEE